MAYQAAGSSGVCHCRRFAARPEPPVIDKPLTKRLLICSHMPLVAAEEQQAMDSEQETEKPVGKRPGRGWTERLTGPIRYRRFTDTDGGGRPSIFFKFELA